MRGKKLAGKLMHCRDVSVGLQQLFQVLKRDESLMVPELYPAAVLDPFDFPLPNCRRHVVTEMLTEFKTLSDVD